MFENVGILTTEMRRNYFGFSSKLSYYKAFHRKFVGNRNEKNSNTYE